MSFSKDRFIELARASGHSEDFIELCLKYAANLQQQELPVIFTPSHLQEMFADSVNLKELIANRKLFYKFYKIRKRDKKTFRYIVSPYSNLRAIQRYIYNEVLIKCKLPDTVHGFVKERSILTNAKPHAGAEAVLKIDLRNFFDTISERRVFGIFQQLGYSKNLAVDFAKLVTVQLPDDYLLGFDSDELDSYRKFVIDGEAVLPQGAPTSPALANLAFRKADIRLDALAKKLGVVYTRYADDITFSGEYDNLPNLKLVAYIIEDEGFNINWKKVGVYRKGGRQLVTGLNVDNGVHIPKAFKREVKKHIYACVQFGVDEHLKFLNLSGKEFYKEWLLGKINYIASIEPDYATKLYAGFAKISWPN